MEPLPAEILTFPGVWTCGNIPITCHPHVSWHGPIKVPECRTSLFRLTIEPRPFELGANPEWVGNSIVVCRWIDPRLGVIQLPDTFVHAKGPDNVPVDRDMWILRCDIALVKIEETFTYAADAKYMTLEGHQEIYEKARDVLIQHMLSLPKDIQLTSYTPEDLGRWKFPISVSEGHRDMLLNEIRGCSEDNILK